MNIEPSNGFFVKLYHEMMVMLLIANSFGHAYMEMETVDHARCSFWMMIVLFSIHTIRKLTEEK